MNQVKTGFLFFLTLSLLSCGEKKLRVGLQPLHGFEPSLTDTVANALQYVYQIQVDVLPAIPVPPHAFVQIKSPRYRADSLIAYFKTTKPDSLDILLALTNYDISITKRDDQGEIKAPRSKYLDWGVMGYGYVSGVSSVVSTFRIQSGSQTQISSRLKKLAIHEVGHNLGLAHCTTELCVMKDAAESMATIDGIETSLCNSCKRKINH